MSPGIPTLEFSVEGAEAVPFAASPRLTLKLRIASPENRTVHSILLRCQIQLEVNRRHYCLQKDVFDRLLEYKRREGLPTWEQTIEGLPAARPLETQVPS